MVDRLAGHPTALTINVTVAISFVFSLAGAAALYKATVASREKKRMREELDWWKGRAGQLHDTLVRNSIDVPVPEHPQPSELRGR